MQIAKQLQAFYSGFLRGACMDMSACLNFLEDFVAKRSSHARIRRSRKPIRNVDLAIDAISFQLIISHPVLLLP
jgi:hypothetical protein